MPTTLSQPLPSFVDRKEEMKRILGFIEKAQCSEGQLLIIHGEPGVGKTRLVQEVVEQTNSRGFSIGCGAGYSESIVPYQPWVEVLLGLGLDHILEELPPPKLLALYLLNSKGNVSARVELKDIDIATLRNAETSLKKARVGSKVSKGSVVKEGNLTIHVLKSQRLLVLQDKNFSTGALIKGREDEAFLDDFRELVENIKSELGAVLRSKKSKSESYKPVKKLMMKFIEGGKYEGIDHARRNPELRRERLFNNIALGIARKALIRPVLIVLDDLQWTDPSSLSLLQYVARNTRTSSVFILGAYRTEAGAVRPHLGKALRKILQEGLSTELDLTGLAREHLRDLSNSFLGSHDLPEDFLDQLWTETEGNPLFVREVLYRLEEDDAIQLKARGKYLMRPVKELDLPERVRDLIRARLKLLSKEDRELLDAAAVCGGRFTASLVARVAGEKETKVLNGLNNIARIHGLLQPVGYEFAFNHSTIQEVVHEGLSKEARQTYHREAAQWLELAGGPVEDIAEHYYMARDKRALAVLHKAASTARDKYANEEAIRFYNEALEFEDDSQKRMEIFESLGDINDLIGNYSGSIESFHNALELAEEKKKKAEITGKIGGIYEKKGEPAISLRFCRDAWNLVKGEESKEEALALSRIGAVHYFKGDYNKARDFYMRSSAILEIIGDQEGIASNLRMIGAMWERGGDRDVALEYYYKGFEISERIDNKELLGKFLNNIGNALNRKGDHDGGLKCLEKGYEIGLKIGDLKSIGISLCNIGGEFFHRGEYMKALEYYQESLEIEERIGYQKGIAIALGNIAIIYSYLNEYDKAFEYSKKSLELSEKIGNQLQIAGAFIIIGILYYEKGDYKQALRNYEKGIAINENIGDKSEELIAHCCMAELCFMKKDYNRAKKYCEKMFLLAKKTGRRTYIGNSRRIFGKIYCKQGKWDLAIENFEESVRTFKETGEKFEEAETHREFGLMWKAKGDFKKAKEHLNKALDIFDKLKLEKKKKKVRVALKSLNTKSTAPR